MAQGRSVWSAVRSSLQDLLDQHTPILRDNHSLREESLLPLALATLHLPAAIGDYTDFYSSKEHASNVGSMFRGRENALLPNWLHMPIAYHGRSSSLVVSGTPIRRPWGQTSRSDSQPPHFGPSREMDFELEVGAFIGPGNEPGEPIPLANALDHVFGLVLVNDWSARDIQRWEYRPLGPFLGKNVATSLSPWVVTLEALAPFRTAPPPQEPPPLPYLHATARWSYDIQLEARLKTPQATAAATISQTNFRYLYWTIDQQIAHHTSNGCNLRPGDLLASGTISGPTADSYGSLLELTWGGTQPLTFPSAEYRTFLEDNDIITLTGWCQGDGYRVGFGEVSGQLLAAKAQFAA
jgi:fumarylacetoacetase